jgi:hypothetical protein
MTPEMYEIHKSLENVHGVPLEFEIELIEVQKSLSFQREPWV